MTSVDNLSDIIEYLFTFLSELHTSSFYRVLKGYNLKAPTTWRCPPQTPFFYLLLTLCSFENAKANVF